MFKSMKTPQDLYKMTTDFFAAVPKTPEDAKVVFQKVQTVFKTEYQNSQDMWKTYQKAATGNATPKEVADANSKATELLKAASFATLVAVPGTVFVLPLIVEKAKEHDIDIVPKSVKETFNM